MRFYGPNFEAWTFADRDLPAGTSGPDVDIHVQLGSDCYVATFYTVERLRAIMDELADNSPQFANGSYFIDESMVIVRSLDEETIATTIADLVANGQIPKIFTKCGSASE